MKRPGEEASVRERVLGLYGEISAALPDLSPVIEQSLAALRRYEHHAYASTDKLPDAFPTTFSQGCNDFVDLLLSISTGQGRAAIRAARSLFEVTTAQLDILSDSEANTRYIEHRWVVAYLESGITLGDDLLDEAERVAVQSRRRWYRKASEAGYERVTSHSKYGPTFRRGWSKQDLRTRAHRHGLGEFYDLYRLASGVLHGGPGGGYGIENLIGGEHVVRTGPALSLCPFAYLFGTRVFGRLLKVPTPSSPQGLVAEMKNQLDRLERLWPAYRRAVLLLDAQLWPSSPPGKGLEAVIAVPNSGSPTWYVWDSHAEQVAPAAEPPDLSAEQKEKLDLVLQITAAAFAEQPDAFTPMAVIILGVEPQPAIGATWLPSSTLWPEEERLMIRLSRQNAGPA